MIEDTDRGTMHNYVVRFRQMGTEEVHTEYFRAKNRPALIRLIKEFWTDNFFAARYEMNILSIKQL